MSVVSNSVRPHRQQPTRLPRPWDSPGKNTGVGCHFLLQCVKVKSFSRVRLLATPWTTAYQAPPSTGFSRREYLDSWWRQNNCQSQLQPADYQEKALSRICCTLHTSISSAFCSRGWQTWLVLCTSVVNSHWVESENEMKGIEKH